MVINLHKDYLHFFTILHLSFYLHTICVLILPYYQILNPTFRLPNATNANQNV